MTKLQTDVLEFFLGGLNHMLKDTQLTPHESTQIIQAVSSLTYAMKEPDDD
jgi:hypothetical protein